MIPPEIFPPQWQVILYIYMFPTIVILGGIAFIIFWKLIMPKESKTLFWNRFFKRSIFAIATDDGFIKFERGKVFPEGIVKTESGQVYMLPRPISHTKAQRLGNPKPNQVEPIALKRFILKNLSCPLWLTYEGKAIATNIPTLLGVQQEKASINLETPPELFMFGGPKIKEKPTKESKLIKVLLPVDPRIIKKWFTSMWNQSQVNAWARKSEEIGFKKAKKQMKEIMIPLVLILIAGIAVMVMIKFA